jgi:hypothetical protein
MEKLKTLSVATLFLMSCCASAQLDRFVGTWEGQTKLPSVVLELREHANTLEGNLTLFSLKGHKQTTELSNVEVTGKTLEFVSADMNFSMMLTRRGVAVLRGKRREFEIEFQMIRRQK